MEIKIYHITTRDLLTPVLLDSRVSQEAVVTSPKGLNINPFDPMNALFGIGEHQNCLHQL